MGRVCYTIIEEMCLLVSWEMAITGCHETVCVCVIRCGMKCALLDILENVFYTKDYYHLFNQRQLEEG